MMDIFYFKLLQAPAGSDVHVLPYNLKNVYKPVTQYNFGSIQ